MLINQLDFELVIPAYNESRSLTPLISKVVSSAKKSGFNPDNFQLIIVENGSFDDSFKVLEQLMQTEYKDWFRVVTVNSNNGYGFGVWQGLITTTAKFVGWSHADLQCDPDDAFRAYSLAKDSYSTLTLVKGIRSGRDWKSVMVSRIFEFMVYIIVGLKMNEINAQPKVFSRKLLKLVVDPPVGFSFDLYILYNAIKYGYEVKEIPVKFPDRQFGVSSWASNFFSRYKTILIAIKYMFVLAHTEGRVKKSIKLNN